LQFDVSNYGLPVTDKSVQKIEVYVPRQDLANHLEESLKGINAKVIHVYPVQAGSGIKTLKFIRIL